MDPETAVEVAELPQQTAISKVHFPSLPPIAIPNAIDAPDSYFDQFSREELISMLKAAWVENKAKPARRGSGVGIDPETPSSYNNFGSVASSSVMFYKAADDSVIRDEVLTDTESVHQQYLALERGAGAAREPDVAEYKRLFKKTLVLNFEADSPGYRKKIETMDKTVEELRSHLTLMVDKCRQYCKQGNSFVDSGKDFSSLLCSLHDPVWADRLGDLAPLLAKLGGIFEEVESYRDAVLLSLETTFSAPMEEFVHIEVKTVKKLKQEVAKCADEYEVNLAKFLHLRKNIEPEIIEQKESELQVMRKKYELARYDLVAELNSLETKKKFQLCERACSALYSYLGFFHQCHTLIATVEPAMRKLTCEVQAARKDFAREVMLRHARRVQLQRELDRAKPLSSALDAASGQSMRKKTRFASKARTRVMGRLTQAAVNFTGIKPGNTTPGGNNTNESTTEDDFIWKDHDIVRSGYLWKKTTNYTKEWVRRWFFIQDGKLYYTRTDDVSGGAAIVPTHVCDLVISTVKENVESDMRYTFEVISPGHRAYTLQGESEEDASHWVKTIRQQIEMLLGKSTAVAGSGDDDDDTNYNSVPNEAAILSVKAANPECVDCGSAAPEWASLNLCCLICIECSGIHRSMGTHVSKVRSLALDKWTCNTLQLMERIGNVKLNSIWDVSSTTKPSPDATRTQREAYINAKYVQKQYLLAAKANANELLFRSSALGDLLDMMLAIAHGADVNWSNAAEQSRTPLHVACMGGHTLAVELLCQWNANVDAMDATGKSPLDYSAEVNEGILDSLVLKLERDLNIR